MICTGEGVVVEGPYANVGTATGDPGVGPIVDETDPSHYLGVALGTDPPVARNDWIQPGCSLSGGGPYSCTVNAPAGTLFADNPGTTASGPSGVDFDPDGDPFTAQIAGLDVVGATGDPWSPPGPQVRTCTVLFLCTTDSHFVTGSSSLVVHADGGFTLTYVTALDPVGALIAEFLYVVVGDDGTSAPALVEVIIQ